jgi:hypothetical protein
MDGLKWGPDDNSRLPVGTAETAPPEACLSRKENDMKTPICRHGIAIRFKCGSRPSAKHIVDFRWTICCSKESSMQGFRFILLAVNAIILGLVGAPRAANAVQLVNSQFNTNGGAWLIYEYQPINGIGHPVTWEGSGGVGNSGYVWGDDSRWAIDTPESPDSILPFYIYTSWCGGKALDMREATMSVYLRGDNLDLKGAQCTFWVLNSAIGTRWHYTAAPLTVSEGTWGTKLSIVLKNDESLWHRSWARYPENPASLDQCLGVAESYGFSFTGFSSEVTGKLSMDELMIATPEPASVVLLATGLFGLLAHAWRRRK